MSATAYLVPDCMRITRHAVDRYMERRRCESRQHAEQAIRDLLGRVAHKCPPVTVRPDGRVCRRYKVGELVFIVEADGSTVITMYHKDTTHRRSSTRRKQNTRPTYHGGSR